MAELECTESSVVATTSSSTLPPHWWDYNSTSSLCLPWRHHHHHHHQQQQKPNSNNNSSCEEDVSISTTSFITNASNHSGLTVESTRLSYELIGSGGEHNSDNISTNNNLWSNVFINNAGIHGNQDVAKHNLLNTLSSRIRLSSSSSGMIFEPVGACDYLKKMDTTTTTNWDLSNSSATITTASFDTNLFDNGGFYDNNNNNKYFTEETAAGAERLRNKLSNWSIAPPIDHHDHYIHTDFSQNTNDEINGINSGFHQEPQHHQDIETTTTPGYDLIFGLNNSSITKLPSDDDYYYNRKYYYHHGSTILASDSPCATNNSSNFGDDFMFSGGSSRLNRPSVSSYMGSTHAGSTNNKRFLKSFNSSDYKKQRPHVVTSSAKAGNGTGGGHGNTNEGKKKRFEDKSETTTLTKKVKQNESSTVSSAAAKIQGPKVKTAERITALQQIVSPFGKTDTASVLLEAIGCIKFLQEQVQILSNPYMKANSTKDPWGNLERKDKGDVNVDLKSRGLCLVPTSCTPQLYRENAGSDYWTPTYRGCLYR